MKLNEEYIIPVGGLSLGEHKVSYLVDGAFFNAFESSVIANCAVNLGITILKESSMLVIDFSQSGNLTLACDRCSYDMNVSVSGENRLIVKYGDEDLQEEDDVVIVKDTKGRLDLSQYVYEYIHLQIPQKNVHKEGGCNTTVLDRLDELNGTIKDSSAIDPRWEALKNINQNIQQK